MLKLRLLLCDCFKCAFLCRDGVAVCLGFVPEMPPSLTSVDLLTLLPNVISSSFCSLQSFTLRPSLFVATLELRTSLRFALDFRIPSGSFVFSLLLGLRLGGRFSSVSPPKKSSMSWYPCKSCLISDLADVSDDGFAL